MKKALRFLLNFFIFIAMAIYVLLGLISAATLVKKEQVSRQEIGELKGILRAAADEGRTAEAVAWVRFRSLKETAELIALVTPESGRFGPDLFFEFSRREMKLGHKEEALFWSQLSRYRLRFDALRCGAPDSVEILSGILRMFSTDEIQSLLQQHPELLKKSIRQVLDFDAKYPASNNPAAVCTALNRVGKTDPDAVAPREQWGEIRQTLRKVSEDALKEMDGDKP